MRGYQQIEQSARDGAAAGYDDWYRSAKGAWLDSREKSVLTRRVPPGSSVLDLGAGTGRIARAAAVAADLTVALDFSVESLRKLRAAGAARVSPIAANAAGCLPFRTGSFDAVLSCQVIQHLMYDDLLECLRECRRVLKDGGLFCFSVYNLGYWRFHRIFEQFDENGLYYRRFNEPYIRDLARRTGFRVRRIEYYKAIPSQLPSALGVRDGWAERADGWVAAVPGLRARVAAYIFAELCAE